MWGEGNFSVFKFELSLLFKVRGYGNVVFERNFLFSGDLMF